MSLHRGLIPTHPPRLLIPDGLQIAFFTVTSRSDMVPFVSSTVNSPYVGVVDSRLTSDVVPSVRVLTITIWLCLERDTSGPEGHFPSSRTPALFQRTCWPLILLHLYIIFFCRRSFPLGPIDRACRVLDSQVRIHQDSGRW